MEIGNLVRRIARSSTPLIAILLTAPAAFGQTKQLDAPISLATAKAEQAERESDFKYRKIIVTSGDEYNQVQRVAWRVFCAFKRQYADESQTSVKFKVVLYNDPREINCSSLSNGTIYVATGLVRVAQSDGVLAAVIGHEYGHVDQHHVEKIYTRSLRNITKKYSEADKIFKNTNFRGLTSNQIKNKIDGIYKDLDEANKQDKLAFSRGLELDADRWGMRFMAAAGYDPILMGTFFRRLKAVADDAKYSLKDIDHPYHMDRVQQVDTFAPQLNFTRVEPKAVFGAPAPAP